jgi:hypothetical protein
VQAAQVRAGAEGPRPCRKPAPIRDTSPIMSLITDVKWKDGGGCSHIYAAHGNVGTHKTVWMAGLTLDFAIEDVELEMGRSESDREEETRGQYFTARVRLTVGSQG